MEYLTFGTIGVVMFETIKTKITEFVKSLSDLRVVGQVFFAVIVLLISWSGVKAIQANYELQKKIVRLEQEVEIGRLENDNLKLENKYLETDEFLELAARRQFGKAAPGETLYIVPKKVAMAHVTTTPVDTGAQASEKKPQYQQNLEDWSSFFFRKSQNKLLQD
jgi:cell division protein FtsB